MRDHTKVSAAALAFIAALIALLGPAAGSSRAAQQAEEITGASSGPQSTTGSANGGVWKTTNFLTTDPVGPVALVTAVGLVPGRSFQIISAGKDSQRLSGTLRQGREVRSGLPLSLVGCGGQWPERWDRRATFSEVGTGPRATTIVEIRVRALDHPSCFLVARVSVAKGE